MKVNGTEITFITDTYADMFHRKAVIAVKKKSGRYYGDITINIPYYSLDDGECFLGNDCPKLISEMVKCGYLEIVDQIKVNMSTYNIGRFTERFQREFGSETYEVVEENRRT